MINQKKEIFIIVGSASQNSSNHKLVANFIKLIDEEFEFNICEDLKNFPHFDPELSSNQAPETILKFRNNIEKAQAVLICTPEYVFSIPSGLKNTLEWCVATTVFNDKPLGLITASANGEKGHEELQLIMKTIMAKFTSETSLLIQGIKGKISENGEIKDLKTQEDLNKFAQAFKKLINPSY